MLVIRLQRVGRKGHAQFRVVVQDSRRTPSSGRVVANLGHYNPHTKQAVINKEKAKFYLDNGAQPSDRVVSLLIAQDLKLPTWVKTKETGKRTTRNPDKLRRNQPKETTTAQEPKTESEQTLNPENPEQTEQTEQAEQTVVEEV